ncbi:MAG TPA: DMT family transporter [Mycobacteriales bacterium]
MLVSAVAFGSMPIMATVAYRSGTAPVALLAVRFAIGAAVLTGIRLVRRAGRRWPDAPTLVTLFLLGAVGYFTQSMAFFSALERIPAALVAILLYLYPAIVVAICAVLARQRPGIAVLVCLAGALVGSALTVGPVRGSVSATGLLLGVAAALTYAVYIVVSARVVVRVDALTSSAVVCLGAATSFGLLTVFTRPSWPNDPGGWLAVVGVGVIGTVVAMICFMAGLALIGPSDTSMTSTAEPVVTVVLGVTVLGEPLRPIQSVGAALIVASVAVLARLPGSAPLPTGRRSASDQTLAHTAAGGKDQAP